MGTPIPTITFNLDISATESSGNNTFFISGTDRTTYSSTKELSFNDFVQQLYYEVGDNIDISFNSNGKDISFIIFNPILDISFVFDRINPNYTISFGTYDNYRFGDSSLNAYGVFNSYILIADTRDDLNTYISSKYNAADPRNRLQQFNRDDRRFIGNYDYIKSDATRIGVDSSGVNNDLIIQSVVNDIHIVTGDKQRTSIWGNLEVHGNISIVGKGAFLEKRVEGIAYDEEDLHINNQPINQYLSAIVDNSFNSINQIIDNHDTSLNDLKLIVDAIDASYVTDTSFAALQSLVNTIDASYVSDTSFVALQSLVNTIDASYVSDISFAALQSLVDSIDASFIIDTSFNALQELVNTIDNSLNLLNFDISYVSYSYFESSYNSLIIEISNKTIDITNLNIIPDQTGNDNKYLFTDGSNLSWKDICFGDGIVTIEGKQGPVGPSGEQGPPGSSDICLNNYSDVSFGNVDISGILKLNNINISLKLTNIDSSLNSINVVNSNNSIAIGTDAGISNIGSNSIAIGHSSGQTDMDHDSIAIGSSAGLTNMGKYSIAIGNSASMTNPNNVEDYIVLNAGSNTLEPSNSSAFYVKPIRNENNNYKLLYNNDSGEITYQIDSNNSNNSNNSSNVNLTGGQDASFNNVDISGSLKINSSDVAIKTDITTAINNLVNGAPGNLDTLNELANALDNSSNFASVVTTKLSNIDSSLSYLDNKALDLTLGQDASFNNVDVANEIKSHKITGTNYFVGTRNIISASAQGNFRDLELKNNNTSNLLASGDTGDLSMNGTLSVNTINGLNPANGLNIEGVTIQNMTISGHSISTNGYYVGSRSIISATAQANFRDLEIKNSLNDEVFLLQGDGNNNLADLSMSGVFKLNNVNITDKLTSLDNNKVDISNIITEFVVTANGGKYFIDNIQTPELTLDYNKTYRFKQDASSNGIHPLRFYTSNNNTSDYSYNSGVTIIGTQGTLGSYSEIIIDANTPNTLYYHCSFHPNMGGKLNIINYPLKFSQIDVSINYFINNNIIEGDDVSFGNVDISGSLLISGNVKLTNGNFEVSNNLIFNTISVGDKISFKETNDTTAYNILNDNLKTNNDASFNNVDISGSLILNNIDISGKLTQIDASLVNLESSISDVTSGLYDLIPNTNNSSAIINQIANNFTESWWLKYYDGSYNVGHEHGRGNLAFFGGVLAPNGKIILVPYDSSCIGIYDPIADTYNDGPEHGRGNLAFAGGVLAPNGKIILVPFDSSCIGIYDPIADTYNDGPEHGRGNLAFFGGVLAPNGKVILVPYDSSFIGIYDPIADTYNDGPEHGRDYNAFFGGVLAPNGKIILVPYDSSFIGIYEPIADTYNDGPEHGRGNLAFAGGVLAPNGKVILVPYDSSCIGIYDPKDGPDGSYNDGPVHGREINPFFGGVLAPNGKIILVPYNSSCIGIYDPNNGPVGSYNDGHEHGRDSGVHAGGVLAPNGKIILVPFDSSCIGIYGGDYPLKNEIDVLSPYFNKF